MRCDPDRGLPAALRPRRLHLHRHLTATATTVTATTTTTAITTTTTTTTAAVATERVIASLFNVPPPTRLRRPDDREVDGHGRGDDESLNDDDRCPDGRRRRPRHARGYTTVSTYPAWVGYILSCGRVQRRYAAVAVRCIIWCDGIHTDLQFFATLTAFTRWTRRKM